MIPKSSKEPTSPKSYRPTALLNQDTKLFTAFLANRLKTIIPSYIQRYQTGIIPHHNIMDNIQRTLNLILFGKKQSYDLTILALDIEKAFDTVEVKYMTTLLTKMGLGNNFLTTIQSLYSAPSAMLFVNGLHSPEIPLQRGTRQDVHCHHCFLQYEWNIWCS